MRRWRTNLEHPEAALKQIGALMVSESQRAFKQQRFGGKVWDPRSKVNVFGILADFHAGKSKPPSRRFQTKPALRDTGRLAGSISFRIEGDTVVVGTNLPYASVHHTGGEVESVPITEQVQRKLADFLLKESTSDEVFSRLAPLVNRKMRDQTLKMDVPERPIVGITPTTLADIKEAVGVGIFEA